MEKITFLVEKKIDGKHQGLCMPKNEWKRKTKNRERLKSRREKRAHKRVHKFHRNKFVSQNLTNQCHEPWTQFRKKENYLKNYRRKRSSIKLKKKLCFRLFSAFIFFIVFIFCSFYSFIFFHQFYLFCFIFYSFY